MLSISYGPNTGKKFPNEFSVQNFEYNGFMVQLLKGFAKWEVKSLIEWTNDPGIGRFMCNDGKIRHIPSCQLNPEYFKKLPKAPKLNPFQGNGIFFGVASSSE